MRARNNTVSYTSAVLITVMLTGSCCCKKECPGMRDENLVFHNFSQDEIDSVSIRSYVANTGFTQPSDTFFQRLANTYTWFPSGITVDEDYEIELNSTGVVYQITDIETERTKCNDCFPYSPESNFYQDLSSYRVNGNLQNGKDIEIYK